MASHLAQQGQMLFDDHTAQVSPADSETHDINSDEDDNWEREDSYQMSASYLIHTHAFHPVRFASPKS